MSEERRGRLTALTALALALPASLGLLKYAPLPYLWISVVWIGVAFVMVRNARHTAVRVLWVNVAVLCLALGAGEGFLAWHVDPVEGPRYPAGYFVKDDVLGTVPAKGTTTRVQEWHGPILVYDVRYTVGADGLRRAPPLPDRGTHFLGCILFFGDSFAYGEGLDDEATLPYRLGIRGGGRYRVYNFAFHGYGAHQMLAALQFGRVQPIARCRPTHIIYEAIPDHVARAAGVYSWGRHGPRYELADGAVTFRGHLDDNDAALVPSPFQRRLGWQLGKSYLFLWLTSRPPRPSAEDVHRYVAIVVTAERVAQRLFPGCRFDVLLWDAPDNPSLYEATREGLRAAGLNLRLVSNILPGYGDRRGSYELSPYDHHPNAHANDLLATYVADSLVGLGRPQDGSPAK